MLWIAERHEWVGVRCEELGSHYEGAYWGREVSLSVNGPLRLSAGHGALILRAYELSDILAANALKTAHPRSIPRSTLDTQRPANRRPLG
jgi:hypothetical protein